MDLDATLLERLRDVKEVTVETLSARGVTHRAVIWIVADARHAYLRSVRGLRGRWYRELRDRGTGALHVDGQRVPVRAIPATSPEEIELVSMLLRAKYGRSSRASTLAMLQPETLPTTMRIEAGASER